MRASFYTLFAIVALVSCKNNAVVDNSALDQSCQRLIEVTKQNSSDTLILKRVLDSASVLTANFSTKRHDSLFAVVSRLLGNQFFSTQPPKARAFYKKGLQIGLRQLTSEDDIIYRLFRNTALTYYNVDDYKTALLYFDSVKITNASSSAQAMRIDNQMNIAECYQYLGDFKTAEQIFEKAQILAQNYEDKTKLANVYYCYAICLRKLKAYNKAVDKAYNGVNTLKNRANKTALTFNDSNLLANCYFSLAYALQDSGAYKSAELYYFEAMSIYKKQNNWDSYKRGLTNLGFLYRFDKQLDKAEKTLTSGITLCNSTKINENGIRLKASFYVNRSEVYLETKQYQKAIADHDSAIYFFTLYNKQPSLTAIMMQARPVLLSVLSDKAKASIALAENGIDTEGYAKALKLTQQVIELTDDIRADYFSDDAKLTLANDIKPALEKAIDLCHQLYQKNKDTAYLHKAFAFVEYSRSMVLYENARLDNQLSPDLKAENDHLKKQEAALIAKNDIEDLQNYLRGKRQFREKIKSLNRNTLASVSTLQTELLNDGQTALIEFFVGDSSIFVFKLLQNSLALTEIPKPKDLEQQIEALRYEITRKPSADDATVFTQQSTTLYALLLRGVMEELPTSVTKWIVAPDGVLSYLPFEFLPKQNVVVSDFRKIDFLLKHYQISYAYSANLLLEQKRIKKSRASQLYAGFASKYEKKDTHNIIAHVSREVLSRQNVDELPRTKEEVNTIKAVIGGKTFVDESATEGVFKREASQYQILHFAMHSIIDNNDPAQNKLLFTLTTKDTTEDNDLTAAELYTMHLNADIAVLSACNTGFGTLAKGEGVMSMARAFTYAGVPATLMSLWNASDETTPDIMMVFYKNLKKGMTKDAALREAKLAYLAKAREPIDANPFFWAGFVPIGNMEALDMTENTPLSKAGVWVGLLIVGGLAMWFWLKKRQKYR